MDEKEAELIGLHVGDGTLYKTNSNSIVWELRGSINEQEFYTYVANLIKDLLSVEVKPKYRGLNSYGIQTTNKTITKFFIANGFNSGKKVYTVRIPDYIKSGSLEAKRGFIRGLFDTDGCVRFDKNRTSVHYYPKIEFQFASKFLSEDLFLLLNELGFRLHKWRSIREDGMSYSLCLSGFTNLDRWTNEIKPANPKHLKRIECGLLNKSKVNLKKRSTNL